MTYLPAESKAKELLDILTANDTARVLNKLLSDLAFEYEQQGGAANTVLAQQRTKNLTAIKAAQAALSPCLSACKNIVDQADIRIRNEALSPDPKAGTP